MNGLILDYFLKMRRSTWKPLLILTLLGMLIGVFASSQTSIYIFIVVLITATPILFFSLFFSDENANWNR